MKKRQINFLQTNHFFFINSKIIIVSRNLQQQKKTEAFQAKGQELNELKLDHVQKSLVKFKQELLVFAEKHHHDIEKNPEFRSKFHAMCSKVGIDPLASKKGFFSSFLGLGDFYYELCVKIITLGISTKNVNGGLIPLTQVLETYKKSEITRNDVDYAISKLSILGNGFKLLKIGTSEVIVTFPLSLSNDHSQLLEFAKQKFNGKKITANEMKALIKWDLDRVERTISYLYAQGFCWLDSFDESYYFPCLFVEEEEEEG